MSERAAAEVYDVTVVGAGPAGLAAAAAATASGATTLILDEGPAEGGQIWRAERAMLSGAAPRPPAVARWLARTERAARRSGVTVYDGRRDPGDGAFVLDTWSASGVAASLRTRAVVLATGATELFLPFPGWTRPNVFGAGGLQALAKGGFDVRGKRVLVAGSGPLLIAVAVALRRAGARVVAVLEQAPRALLARFITALSPRKLAQGARYGLSLLGTPVHTASYVLAAEGPQDDGPQDDGPQDDRPVRRVRARIGDREVDFEVDLLAIGFGLVPATGLGELLGARRGRAGLEVDADLATAVPGLYAAGEVTGVAGVNAALAEGTLAGLAAAAYTRGQAPAAAEHRRAQAAVARERRFAERLAAAFQLRPELRQLAQQDTIVCRCEDVPRSALEAFREPREAKLAARCGMGPCQARVCGPALEALFGWPREAPRPPLSPVPFQALAERTSPI